MQLFYNKTINTETQQIIFDKIESKHIVRVLRKKENDILHVTNGKGYLFEVEIIIASDKKCTAKIVDFKEKPKHWQYYLHIAIAPTKNNDRLEWFLEKATEIGIDEITPIICQNSERKVVKNERLEKVILAAMKQSLKFNLPKLNPAIKYNDFLKNLKQNAYIAHCENGEKKSLKESITNNSEIIILIGPEGDFSLPEIDLAQKHNITPISLGNSRLRTETAGLVAVQNVSFLHQ